MNNIFTRLIRKIKPFYLIKLSSSFFTQIGSLFLIYLLNPSELGHLALVVSVAQLMFVLTSGWSNGAVINLGSKKYAETGSYKDIIYYRSAIVLISFLIISILFICLKGAILNFILDASNYSLVYLLFLGYVFYDFSSQLLYPGNKDLVQSLSELVATIALLTFTLLFVSNVREYVYIYSGTFCIFALVIISLFIFYFGKQKVTLDKNEFLFVLKYSFWQILSIIGIYVINIGINYVLVFNKVSVENIGLYNFSYKLFSGFSPFFALFGILIPKWIYSIDKTKLHDQLMKRFFYCICALSALYLLVAGILKPFIILVGKEDYLKSVEYFFYLFPAFLFLSYTNLINTVIMNTKYFKQAQFAIVLQGISLLIFSFPLVNLFGIIGALFSTTMSFIVGAIYLNVLYNKKVKKSFQS